MFDESAHVACMPVTYLFSLDGKAILAVMVMKMNQRRTMIARGTSQILEKKGITCVRFYKEMENDKAYIADRIRENL